LDADVARRIVAEIAPRAEGARIVGGHLAARDCLVLDLGGKLGHLVFSTMRALPLVVMTEHGEGVPPARADIGDGLARELRGATITSLAAREDGTTIDLFLERTDPAGRTARRVLTVNLGREPGWNLRDAGEPREPAEPTSPRAETLSPEGGAAVRTWHDGSGRLHVRIGPDEPGGDDREARAFESYNEAARFAFAECWSPLDLERRRGAVTKAIRGKLRRKRRAADKVRAEIEGARRAGEYRAKAQLLLTRKDQIPRGRTPVEVLDFDNTTTVTIDIDPALDVARNADALFRRAKKAERRAERAPSRLGELEEMVRKLEEAEAAAGEAAGNELARLEAEFLPPRETRAPRQAEKTERARYRTYVVSGGWEVLVGKSNRDNDVLSHKIARPNDLWFHARQVAGSHVVLRRAGRKEEPDKRAILETAAIAAYHSKAGRSSKTSVCYTERRHVRKPRGAKPGLAVVSREKVVMVKPKLPET